MPKPNSLFLILFISTSLACRLFSGPVIQAQDEPAPTENPPLAATPEKVIQNVNITNAAIHYYEINGNTEQDLRQQMNEFGPLDDNYQRFDAVTNWYISWNWPGYGTENCDLSTAETGLTIDLTLPRWNAPNNPDPNLVQKWNLYISNLAFHEQGHVDNILSYYPQVLTAIQNATCLTADQSAQNILEQIRQADRLYDETTSHGATQGALFP